MQSCSLRLDPIHLARQADKNSHADFVYAPDFRAGATAPRVVKIGARVGGRATQWIVVKAFNFFSVGTGGPGCWPFQSSSGPGRPCICKLKCWLSFYGRRFWQPWKMRRIATGSTA